jgi:hypothetical protein
MEETAMSEMTITLEAKNRYGTWFYYPTCEKARYFVQIEGGKTLSTGAMALIRMLGYEIEIKSEVPTTPNV